jgi:hypothetical protein
MFCISCVVYNNIWLNFPRDECKIFSFFMGVFTILGTIDIKVKSLFPIITCECDIQAKSTLGWTKNGNCKVHFQRFFGIFSNIKNWTKIKNL